MSLKKWTNKFFNLSLSKYGPNWETKGDEIEKDEGKILSHYTSFKVILYLVTVPFKCYKCGLYNEIKLSKSIKRSKKEGNRCYRYRLEKV